MYRTGRERRDSENNSKFIQQRITNVEKHFGEMCQDLGNYLRRSAKLRDCGDDFCRSMTRYAETETFNTSTRESLVNFANHFSAVQDYRDVEIKRMDKKVLEPMAEYGTECKHAKEKLKKVFASKEKELKQQKNLNKSWSSTDDKKRAENDLQKASVEATRADKQLETEMEEFEKRKLQDIKKIFLEFVNVEMMFHAKAMEMYTQCFQGLTMMNEDQDLEEFRGSLRPPTVRRDSRAGSLNSLITTGLSAHINGMFGESTGTFSAQSTAKSTQNGGKSTPTGTPTAARKPPPAMTPNETMNTTNRSSKSHNDTMNTTQRSSKSHNDTMNTTNRSSMSHNDTMNTTNRSSMYPDTHDDEDSDEDEETDDDDSDDESWTRTK